MSKSLSLIVQEASKIEQMLIESEGEMTAEIEAFLNVNSAELADKVDKYDLVMSRLEAAEMVYKRRADEIYSIATKCKNTRDRLEKNIKFAMQELGTSEVLGNDVRFKLVGTKAKVNILDESKLPKEYMRTKTVVEVDKTKLGEDLKIGPIAGAELVPGFSLRTYPTQPQLEGKKK